MVAVDEDKMLDALDKLSDTVECAIGYLESGRNYDPAPAETVLLTTRMYLSAAKELIEDAEIEVVEGEPPEKDEEE